MFEVDLSNNTKFPDLNQYFGYSSFGIFYMHLEGILMITLSLAGNSIVLFASVKYKVGAPMKSYYDVLPTNTRSLQDYQHF